MMNYFRNWNFMRVLRLALAIFVLIQGIQTHQWLIAILGLFFGAMAFMNVGCCASPACQTPKNISNQKTEEVIYEEVR